ncbi:MAG: DUF3459 domain-containing protein [Thermoguttaceae bacterium]
MQSVSHVFMGEEYGERRPFPFFCSFDDPLVVEGVRVGRRQEFAALDFRWGVDIPDPQDYKTFAAAKLGWAWPEGSAEAQHRQLYQDLLAARRRWPALRDRRHTTARVLGDPRSTDRADQPALLLLQRGGDDGLLAVANLTPQNMSIAALNLDGRQLLLSTEDARYGGERNVSGTLRVPRSAIGTRSVPDTMSLPKGEGTLPKAHSSQLLPHELLVFDRSGGRPWATSPLGRSGLHNPWRRRSAAVVAGPRPHTACSSSRGN